MASEAGLEEVASQGDHAAVSPPESQHVLMRGVMPEWPAISDEPGDESWRATILCPRTKTEWRQAGCGLQALDDSTDAVGG